MIPARNMLVSLEDLPVRRVVELPATAVGALIAEMPTRAILDRPADDPDAGSAEVQLDLHCDDDGNVYARGQVSGWFQVACSRCVEPVRFPFEEAVMATYLPGGQLAAATAGDAGDEDDELGLELSGDELDLYGYEGRVVDLEPLIREHIILAVPFAPLCAEDCRGLCPQCGVDRNREACDCRPPIDPRLAALQGLKP